MAIRSMSPRERTFGTNEDRTRFTRTKMPRFSGDRHLIDFDFDRFWWMGWCLHRCRSSTGSLNWMKTDEIHGEESSVPNFRAREISLKWKMEKNTKKNQWNWIPYHDCAATWRHSDESSLMAFEWQWNIAENVVDDVFPIQWMGNNQGSV